MSTLVTLSNKLAPFGPTALVTGASDGMGAATARRFAEAGFNLILSARRQWDLDALAQELRDRFSVSVEVVASDLSTPEGLSALQSSLKNHDVGTAVLAAGFGTTGTLSGSSVTNEINMLQLNCGAILTLCHVLGRSMEKRGRGQLVLFGSILGFQGNGGTANYAATKAYVQSLAEGLAIELRPKGVEVLSVAPGPVSSGFAQRAGMVLGQAGTPQEIATGILKSVGSSGTIRPGLLSKLLGYGMAMTPRPLRIRIMSQIMQGMIDPAAKGLSSAQPATTSPARSEP